MKLLLGNARVIAVPCIKFRQNLSFRFLSESIQAKTKMVQESIIRIY